jgi:hypothetical protein
MNKRANRRAFFICTAICLIYVSLALRLPEKLNVKRISDEQRVTPNSMNLSIPKSTPPVTQTTPNVTKDESFIEPSFFISIPIVCSAIKEGLIEKEGLIFIKKNSNNDISCKKPIDILKDRDEEGLKSISKIIGKKYSLDFLKKEGITHKKGSDIDETILGKGFVLEKQKLLSLCNTYVPEEYSRLFPFIVSGIAIVRGKNGFEFINAKDNAKGNQWREDSEWLMPNLLNLPMKSAIEKLTTHTSKVKVYGSGNVTEQHPKPFERIKGETECVIYGRTYKP